MIFSSRKSRRPMPSLRLCFTKSRLRCDSSPCRIDVINKEVPAIGNDNPTIHDKEDQVLAAGRISPRNAVPNPGHPTDFASPRRRPSLKIPVCPAQRHVSSSSTTSSESERCLGTIFSVEGEESFHYLRSLITVSTQAPHEGSSPSGSEPSLPRIVSKRASLRLSMRPALLVGTKALKKKPSPRYTFRPPVYARKPTKVRPEVRF